MTPPTRLLVAGALLAAAGCSDRSLDDDAERDPNPPHLVVTTPDRGLLSDTQSIRVSGEVSDVEGGPVEVHVNGIGAKVDASGHFEVQLNLPAGMSLVQTIAEDESGNKTLDTRSVLAGQLSPLDRPVREAMAVHLGPETFASLASITSGFVDGTDLGSAAQGFNPIVDRGGSCLGVALDVDSIAKSGVEASFTPTGGGIHVSLAVTDLAVGMTASYDVACVGSSAGVDLAADRFVLEGTLTLALDGDRIDVGLVDTSASFEGFSLDVGIIPSSVVEFFVNDIDQKVADLIAGQVEDMVPSLASSFLSDFAAATYELPVRDQTLQIHVTPKLLDLDPAGATVALDSDIRISGAEGPGYVYTPAPMPSPTEMRKAGQGFRVAVADDAVNQVLASVHASGLLDLSLPLGEGDGGSVLGAIADRLDVHLMLPPALRADVDSGAVQVLIGDMIIDVVNETSGGDQVVTKLAVSGRLDLGAHVDGGRVRLETTAPEVFVDVLEDGVIGPNPLDYDQVEALASSAATNIAALVDDFLAEVPIPVFGGTGVSKAEFEAKQGYAIIGGELGPEVN